MHGKPNRLVLVATAGSATTSSLELPALGANVGPGEETVQFIKVHHKYLYKIMGLISGSYFKCKPCKKAHSVSSNV